MRILLSVILLFFCSSLCAQKEKDSVYRRCPVFITDTVSLNNFFLEALPATVKVFRDKGNLTIAVEQRDQLFSMFFRDKKLKSGKYRFKAGARKKNDIEAKYSFRSGTQASYVNISGGTVETIFEKDKNLWHIKVNGTMLNMVERSVTHFRVRADFYIQ